MKKIIFIIALVSLFATTGLALANDVPSSNSFGELWSAISELKDQIFSLKAELKATKELQVKQLEAENSKTIIKETPSKKTSSGVSQSEHYVMRGLRFQ